MQNKQPILREWSVVSHELSSSLSNCSLSYKGLSKAAGIGYDAARRYKLGRLSNFTKNAKKLCEFYNIPIQESANLQISDESSLLSAIHELWDGTPAHAELIIELVKSTIPFEIRNKNKGKT